MKKTLYWVSDGNSEPVSFEDIEKAANKADEIKGLVLTVTGPKPTDFDIVYSHGERAVLSNLK